MPRLEKWSVLELSGGVRVLSGLVYGHPSKPDGTRIWHTSPIVGARGYFVTTRTGSTYQLGDVDPEYREAQGAAYDPDNPVKVEADEQHPLVRQIRKLGAAGGR